MGRVIPWNRRGLRQASERKSLSPDIARDPTYSCARPSDAPFPAQSLGRLYVSRRLGYQVLRPLNRSVYTQLLPVSASHQTCAFSNRVMTRKRDSGQFLKTLASTANWHFDFQDGKMDVRTGKEAGFGQFGSQSGKSNVI